MAIPVLLLFVLLALLSRHLQATLRGMLARRAALAFVVAAGLAILFCATAAVLHSLNPPLALVVTLYLLVPTACMFLKTSQQAVVDLAIILMLWLPLEFSAGARLVARHARGVLHATAYGVALVLAVTLFLLLRRWHGMRYQLPRRTGDLAYAATGYLVAAITLIPLGIRLGFLPHAHAPHLSPAAAFERFAFIFFSTAFPEEILFRSLIQNWLTKRMKQPWHAVAIAGLIFGVAHLDNGPQPLPNWRYMIEATIAGWIFGTVFLRSTSVLASAAVHAAVDMTKSLFF